MENEAHHADQSTTPDQNSPTGQTTTSAPKRNTLMAILAYLGILIIIPFLMAKDDPFVKFHIKQGLVLVIIELVIYVLGMAMGIMWLMFFPVMKVVNIIHFALIVFSITGIVNVVQGQEKKLPLVGHLADNFTF